MQSSGFRSPLLQQVYYVAYSYITVTDCKLFLVFHSERSFNLEQAWTDFEQISHSFDSRQFGAFYSWDLETVFEIELNLYKYHLNNVIVPDYNIVVPISLLWPSG